MKLRIATLIMLAAPVVMLAAPLVAVPAFAQGPPGAGMGTFSQEPLPNLPQTYKLPPEPEARADDYRMQGRCNAAMPIYRALAAQGTGYELAEYNLGRCLLDTAAKQADPQAAAAMRLEAVQWTVKAANSGLPNAQNALVSVYLDGVGIAADPVEAGKWSLLYHSNGSRRLYGLPDTTPAVQARLDAALNDQSWAQAKARANAWNPPAETGSADR